MVALGQDEGDVEALRVEELRKLHHRVDVALRGVGHAHCIYAAFLVLPMIPFGFGYIEFGWLLGFEDVLVSWTCTWCMNLLNSRMEI